MSKIVTRVLDNYPGTNSTTEQAWDFIQRNVSWTRWSRIRFSPSAFDPTTAEMLLNVIDRETSKLIFHISH